MAPQGNERFSDEAASWDSNPDVHRASEAASKAILEAFPELMSGDKAKSIDVLEIGCGTGLLSFRIAPHVRSLLAIDAAPGMIDALEKKLRKARVDDKSGAVPDNIQPLCIMLEDPEDSHLPPQQSSDDSGPRKKFDLILSHLVLHHIPGLRQVLQTMYGCLKSGGVVALTDYEDFGPEARKFHPEAKMFGVERHGIKKEWFSDLMTEVGFVDVDVRPAWTMAKEVESFPGEWGQEKPTGEGVSLPTMDFPFLLCKGRKP